VQTLLADLRFAVRSQARQPAFAATAVLVLALGIGANAAVFSFVNALLLKPLPGVRDGHRIVGLYARDTRRAGNYRGFSYPNYVDVAEGARALEGVSAYTIALAGVYEEGVTRRSFVQAVSANYFDLLGAAPVQGRAFTVEEERPGGAATVAVVSHAYWKKRGADRSLLGRAVTINGRLFTIVGIAPPGFEGTSAGIGPDFWLPLGSIRLVENDFLRDIAGGDLASRDTHKFLLFARLKAGSDEEAASRDLAALAARLAEAYPAANRDFTIVAAPLSRLGFGPVPGRNDPFVRLSAVLLAMSGVVLLVACLNVANLLLARGTARRKEIAIRLSLGARRMTVVRQLLTEGFVLAFAGALAGLTAGRWAMALLVRSVAPLMPMPIDLDMGLDWRIAAATLAFAAAATVLFALGPALKVTRRDVTGELKEQSGDDRGRHGRLLGARNLMLAGQMALSLALLATGALFVRSAVKAAAATPGFPLDRVLLVEVDASLAGYSRTESADAHRRAVARLRGMPGVETASMASIVPFGSYSEQVRIERPGAAGQGSAAGPLRAAAERVSIGADYLRSIQLPLIRGRAFTPQEAEGLEAKAVAVIDEPAARQLFPGPGEDPVGRFVRVGSDDGGQVAELLEIVGVVAGVRSNLLDRAAAPHVYVPFASRSRVWMYYHLRLAPNAPDEASMLAAARRELAALDPRLPVLSLRSLRSFVRESVFLWLFRSGAKVFTAFGLAALVLALAGIYGVNAYMVLRRTREIGIRMALGATPRDVVHHVVRDTAFVAATGVLVGTALALAVGTLLGSMLYDVSALDPIALLAAPALLAGCALAAALIPARRAARVSILSALRRE
jgi:predicted permease